MLCDLDHSNSGSDEWRPLCLEASESHSDAGHAAPLSSDISDGSSAVSVAVLDREPDARAPTTLSLPRTGYWRHSTFVAVDSHTGLWRLPPLMVRLTQLHAIATISPPRHPEDAFCWLGKSLSYDISGQRGRSPRHIVLLPSSPSAISGSYHRVCAFTRCSSTLVDSSICPGSPCSTCAQHWWNGSWGSHPIGLCQFRGRTRGLR